MIPSRYECPPGWTREYYGYLMAEHHNSKASSQFSCIDHGLEQVPGSGSDIDGYRMWNLKHIVATCSDKNSLV